MRKLAFLLLAAVSLPCLADEVWRVNGGVTTLWLDHQALHEMGLRVTKLRTTAEPDMAEGSGFAIRTDSTLRFTVRQGALHAVLGGEILHHGGFVIESGRADRDFRGFRFAHRPDRSEAGFSVLSAEDKGGGASADLRSVWTVYTELGHKMYVLYADLLLSPEWARAMGRPELAGTVIGTETVYADAILEDGEDNGGGGPPHFGPGIDVRLTDIDFVRHDGRLGDTVSITLATTLYNEGDTDVPWYWAIDPAPGWAPIVGQHPFLIFNLYRVTNGRLEQIGRSDMKHGFYSVNSGCPDPSAQYLGVGCYDTYSSSNNADPFYFGPRDEVNPWTGDWERCGSHFDGPDGDCVRDSQSHNAIEHRLQAKDADLGVSGASYYIEATYLVKDDVNRWNNWGHRRITPSQPGGPGTSWNYSLDSLMQQGPFIDSWGDSRTTLQTGEGDAVLAVRVTNPGGGTYRYEYALMNQSFTRKFRSFSLPLPAGANVSNVGFNDPDFDAGNEWAATVGSDRITWETADNPLGWGLTHSFWFDADAPPVASAAQVEAFAPGVAAYAIQTVGPAPALRGHVDLALFSGSPAGVPIEITLKNGVVVVETLATTLDAAGNYAVSPSDVGMYDLVLKASHWLSEKRTGVLVGGAAAVNWVCAHNGDALQDNSVDLTDLNRVLTAFAGSDPASDLDGDGQVGLPDLNIVLSSFGLSGDE